jgi:hypothetical protein
LPHSGGLVEGGGLMEGGLLLRARTNLRGRRGAVTIELPAEWTLAAEVDLLEGGADAPSLVFRPFQVCPWRLERRR